MNLFSLLKGTVRARGEEGGIGWLNEVRGVLTVGNEVVIQVEGQQVEEDHAREVLDAQRYVFVKEE